MTSGDSSLTRPPLARYGCVLELVEVGPLEQVEHAVDVVRIAAVHQADEYGLVADDEGRHPEHRVALHGFGVRCASTSSGRPVATSAAMASGSRPTEVGDLGEHVVLGDLGALFVTGGERRDVKVEGNFSGTLSRTAMPHSRAVTPVPRSAGSRSQTAGSPSSTWTWSSEKGRKVTSTVAAGPESGDNGIVAVAGERTPVIERHCE